MNRKSVMLGSWQIGGSASFPYYPEDARLTIEHGPFAGSTFPSALATQLSPSPKRLPPLARYSQDGIDFMPFVLYDKVIIDEVAFKCLLGEKSVISGWYPSDNSVDILEKLAGDGQIILKSYNSILDDPDAQELVNVMSLHDLNDSNILIPGKASLKLWIEFYKDLLGDSNEILPSLYKLLESLESNNFDKDVFGIIYECIADINRALVISQILEMPVYDWEDYNQYYKYKFLRTAQTKSSIPQGRALQEIFNVFIPNFHIHSYSQLRDIRSDNRLDSIRKLTVELGDEPITKDLVIQAYQDVLLAENEVKSFSKYTGLVGFVLNVLPGPIGDIFQLATNSLYARWQKRKYKWQTFFVEKSTQYRKNQIENTLHELEK